MSRVARIVVIGFAHHITQRDNRRSDVFETDDLLYADFPPTAILEDWSSWLTQPDKESVVRYIRQQTQTGCPCGSGLFLTRLERLLYRTGRRKKPGSKPKRQQQPEASTLIRKKKEERRQVGFCLLDAGHLMGVP